MRCLGEISKEQASEQEAGGSFAPCVLMMVQAGEWYTAQLRELLTAFGFTRKVDALETTLTRLEYDSLVCAVRDATTAVDDGEAPRWRLTATGEEWLATRSSVLAESGRLVGRFLQRYPGLVEAGCVNSANGAIPGERLISHDRAGLIQR